MQERLKKRRTLLTPKPDFDFWSSADLRTETVRKLLHKPRIGTWNEVKGFEEPSIPKQYEREYQIVEVEKTFTRWTRPYWKRYYRTGITKLTPLAAYQSGLISKKYLNSLRKNKAKVVRLKKRLSYREYVPAREIVKTKVYKKRRRIWRNDPPVFKDGIIRDLPLAVATTKPLKPYTNTIISCEPVLPHSFTYGEMQLDNQTWGIEIPDFTPRPPHYIISRSAIRNWITDLIDVVYDQQPTRYDYELEEEIDNIVFEELWGQFDIQGISDLFSSLAEKGQFVNGVIIYQHEYSDFQRLMPTEVFSHLVENYQQEVWDEEWEAGVPIGTNVSGIIDAFALRDLVSNISSKFLTGVYKDVIREQSISDTDLPFSEIDKRAEYLRQKIHSTPIRGAPAMAVWLAELPSTIKSFHEHLVIMMRLAKALKSKNVPQAIKAIEDAFNMRSNRTFLGKKTGKLDSALKAVDIVNNEILAWRFGFQPFFEDLFNFLEFYRKLDHAQAYEPKKRRHRLGGEKALTVDMQVNENIYLSFPQHEEVILAGTITGTAKVHFEVEYGCMMVIENYATALLKSLGFTNPLQVAWELIPLSFVVNWFVDISSALESFDLADDSYSVYDEYISITAHMPETDFSVILDHDFIIDHLGLEYDTQDPATIRIGFVTIDRERRPDIDQIKIARLMAVKPLDSIFSLSKAFTALQLLWQRSK